MTRTRTALFALALASLSAPALAMTYVETPS